MKYVNDDEYWQLVIKLVKDISPNEFNIFEIDLTILIFWYD